MKTLIYKLCLIHFFIIFYFNAITQDNYIDSLKKVLQTEKEDTNKITTLDYLCSYYYNRSDSENILQSAKAVLALATKINYKIGIADGYLNIGLAYNVKKDRFNESEYFNKALALYKEIGNKQEIINCYDWMNHVYRAEDNVTKAFESVFGLSWIKRKG
jgi:tetratricopeptide (TPR) repeat protein